MYRILRHGSHIPSLPEESSQVLPRSGMQFRHTSEPISCPRWYSQIWPLTYNLLNGPFWQAATDYQHMIPLQGRLWMVYTDFALLSNDSCCSIPSISPSFLNPLNLGLPATTECPSFRQWTVRCRRGSSRSAPANIWIYDWSLCEGCCWNAITVMLHVNPSVGGRCPPNAYHRYTALGDK